MSTLLQTEAAAGASAPEEFLRQGAPLIESEQVPLCPVCGGEWHAPFASGFDYELRTCSNEWRFVQCTACEHVWLNPRPAVSEIGVIYPPTYYAYNYGKINPVARRAKELLDRRKMARIVKNCARKPRTFLDVGCGDGRFLRVMERAGVPRDGLYGLELDPHVVEGLRAEGYPGVFCERVETAPHLPENGLDLITMFHVIEHVDDPGAVVRQIGKWLAPGGVFALETPNLDSWDARLFHRNYWGGYHIPRHWNLFTPSTMSRLLVDNGLEVVGTAFQTGHSFWMYSLHHLARYEGRSRPQLGEWLDPMKSLFTIGAVTALDIVRGALGAKTSAMLMICRKPA